MVDRAGMGLTGAAALCAAVSLSATAPAAAQATDAVMTAAALQAAVAAPIDGRASRNFWTGPGYVVQASLRMKPGEVEIHEVTADLFIVQEGRAEVLLGGAVAGNRVTGPNEKRGGQISGGHVRSLGPGDTLWIPASEPHQVRPIDGAFRYLVVKIDTKTLAAAAGAAPP